MSERKSPGTVLVIEDEADVRHFISRVLELEGYRVLPAEDGETGLKLVRENQIALVLLDLRLPGRDGWAVLAELKKDPALASIPVVVSTASADVAFQERALTLGAADYLVKPFSAASLKTAVGRALRHRE